ncbi:riboflavin kinase/FMN adenylyltransferase [Kordia periserrulae]|uniref:Riboflavin biosynthesis protein n=1 Tax=Kordia periserrulae TaxID=701523 RepID=A0A2T6BTE4_9FLAO|nr:bifunctional riboflavin kinase/FAD synthetase [Kordia periserrulae]PTX59237.1 riboflavin kinase/FMN adenylyltransferase [Kordia periserrulae]
MNTIDFFEAYKAESPSAITIGTFDGVHVGHKKIIENLIEKSEGLNTMLLTFFPHPRMVLQQDSNIKLINTIDERVELLEATGLDTLIIYPFNKEFSRLKARDFVRNFLIDHLNLKKIIIGYDHRFGRNRTANIDDLREFGQAFDFKVEEIKAKEIDDITISSTKIRKALNEGDITTANTYLGYEFMLTGTVIAGKGLGNTIDFPTANIHIKETYKLIPKQGVYFVKSALDGETVFGMMNIGTNPTVKGTNQTIEVHFFNFNRDIYGKKVQIRLIKRLRDERKFGSVTALQAQLEKDKQTCETLIQNYHAH